MPTNIDYEALDNTVDIICTEIINEKVCYDRLLSKSFFYKPPEGCFNSTLKNLIKDTRLSFDKWYINLYRAGSSETNRRVWYELERRTREVRSFVNKNPCSEISVTRPKPCTPMNLQNLSKDMWVKYDPLIEDEKYFYLLTKRKLAS